MRRDYFNLCSDYPALEQRLRPDGRFVLDAMSRESLRDAIEKPLLLAGETQASARRLAEEVLLDLPEQPGNLALVEMALSEVWSRRAAYGGDLARAYAAIARLERALATAAEDVFENPSGDPGRLQGAERPIAESLFMRLVRIGDGGSVSRRIVRRQELSESGWSVAQKLSTPSCRRLLVLGKTAGDAAGGSPDSDDAAFVVELRTSNWLRNGIDISGGCDGATMIRYGPKTRERSTVSWTGQSGGRSWAAGTGICRLEATSTTFRRFVNVAKIVGVSA